MCRGPQVGLLRFHGRERDRALPVDRLGEIDGMLE